MTSDEVMMKTVWSRTS